MSLSVTLQPDAFSMAVIKLMRFAGVITPGGPPIPGDAVHVPAVNWLI
jgi:hypothetical protein